MAKLTEMIVGGGATPINGIEQFANAPVLHTDEENQVWLKAGNYSNDTTTYPDALTTVSGGNVNTASYITYGLVNMIDGSPTDIFVSKDGWKLYTISQSSRKIHEFQFEVQNDISTLFYTNRVTTLSTTQTSTPYAASFSDDLSKMYIAAYTKKRLVEYDLTTPGDITTATYSGNFIDTSTTINGPIGVHISHDGTKIYGTDNQSNFVRQFNLVTPYDTSTAVYSNKSFDMTQLASTQGSHMNEDESLLYGSSIANGYDRVYQYALSTHGDISTASYTGKTFSFLSQSGNIYGIALSKFGVKMFGVDSSTYRVYEWDLSEVAIGILEEGDLDPNTYVRIK